MLLASFLPAAAAAASSAVAREPVAVAAGGDRGQRDAHDREPAQHAEAVLGLDVAALAVGLVVVERDQPVEGAAERRADLVDASSRGDEDEVVAGDVADEVARRRRSRRRRRA